MELIGGWAVTIIIIGLAIFYFILYHSFIRVVYFGNMLLEIIFEFLVCMAAAVMTIGCLGWLLGKIVVGIIGIIKWIVSLVIIIVKVALLIGAIALVGYGVYLLIQKKKNKGTADASAVESMDIKKPVACICIGLLVSAILLGNIFKKESGPENISQDHPETVAQLETRDIPSVEQLNETVSQLETGGTASVEQQERIVDFLQIQQSKTVDNEILKFTVNEAYSYKVNDENSSDTYVLVKFRCENVSSVTLENPPEVVLVDPLYGMEYYENEEATRDMGAGNYHNAIYTALKPGEVSSELMSVYKLSQEMPVNGYYMCLKGGDAENGIYIPFDGAPDWPREEQETLEMETDRSTSDEPHVMISDSSIRMLTDSDVYQMTPEEIRIAINEIYARHGRRFKDAALQAYFDSQAWYQGSIEPEAFDENVLSQIEKDNIKFLQIKKENPPTEVEEKTLSGIYQRKFASGGGLELEIVYSLGNDVYTVSFVGSYYDYAGETEGYLAARTDGRDGVWNYYENGSQEPSFQLIYDGRDEIVVRSMDGKTFGGRAFPGFEGAYHRVEEH